MLPLHALLSHAELTVPRPCSPEQAETRNNPRRPRYGTVTLYPLVQRMPTDTSDEEPTLVASLSNVSRHGVGLINGEPLPAGMQFDVRWALHGGVRLLRFEVVHSQPTLDGMFRTGARLTAGELPDDPAPIPLPDLSQPDLSQPELLALSAPEASASTPVCEAVADDPIAEPAVAGRIGIDAEPVAACDAGVLHIEPSPTPPVLAKETLPPGTFQASTASGFEKIERLDGVTTCGWERQVELRRVGERLWIYIHSPGKKNGWGIYVDPDQFQAALGRVQESASSPFVTSIAA